MNDLTDRQNREIDYHRQRATLVGQLREPITYDILDRPHRRWWNHHWAAYATLLKIGIEGKSILVPGCGEGGDAIRFRRLGAKVYAFDISPDMLEVARKRAEEEQVQVDFRQMPAEQLGYPDRYFDVVFARDVLHHCDLSRCLPELLRVLEPGGVFLIDELYTHHRLQYVRESRLGWWLWARFLPVIYPTGHIYTTQDERKLSDYDLAAIRSLLTGVRCRYYNMVVNRFLPSWKVAERLDRLALKLLGPAGFLFAGRLILVGFAPY
jgi:ubiquinone/menaquinone biosynthesis C-methylase UbiE